MGRTLDYFLDQCNIHNGNLDTLSSQKVKSKIKYIPKTTEDDWKDDLAQELMKTRKGEVKIEGFSQDQIDDIF